MEKAKQPTRAEKYRLRKTGLVNIASNRAPFDPLIAKGFLCFKLESKFGVQQLAIGSMSDSPGDDVTDVFWIRFHQNFAMIDKTTFVPERLCFWLAIVPDALD